MPDTVLGLPLHPLVVHATVVVLPAAALAVALAVLWPRFRAWAGWLPLALSAAAVVLVPVSTSSGENLEHTVGESSLVERHAELADMMLPWTIGLLVVAAVAFWWSRTSTRPGTPAARLGFLRFAIPVAGIVVAVGTLVQVALVGHSGAKSAWEGKASASSSSSSSSDGN